MCGEQFSPVGAMLSHDHGVCGKCCRKIHARIVGTYLRPERKETEKKGCAGKGLRGTL
jgi:hypothetical protein